MFGSTLKRGRLPAAIVLAALTVTLTACAGGQADKADPVGSTTATLNGYWKSTVSNPPYVIVYFKYGTTTPNQYYVPVCYRRSKMETASPTGGGFVSRCTAAGPANAIHKFSAPVTGLTPNTTYHFTLVRERRTDC